MYKPIKNHKEVLSFIYAHDLLCYKTNVSRRKRELFVGNDKINAQGITGYGVYKNKVVFSTWSNTTYIFDTENKDLKQINYSQVSEFNIKKGTCLMSTDEALYKYLYDVEYESDIIKINSDKFENRIYFSEKLLITINDSDQTIQAFSLYNDSKQWDVSLAHLEGYKSSRNSDELNPVEVQKFIGIYKDVLWVILSNGFLLGIDSVSGTEKHYIGIAENNPTEQMRLSDLGHAYINQQYKIDEMNGKIILLDGISYFEVDLNHEKPVKTWTDLSPEMDRHKIKCEMNANDGFQFDNQYFYFYDGPKGIVAIMNRKTFEIEWEHQLNIDAKNSYALSLLRDLKISANKLFVHDCNNTLHIFEKE